MSDYLDENLSIIQALGGGNGSYLNNLRTLADWASEYYLKNGPLVKDYTDHDVGHSKRVMDSIDKLTFRFMEQPEKLCDKEIYILLAACYLHDLGMHYEYLEKLPFFQEIQKDHPNIDFSRPGDWDSGKKCEIIQEIRERHHLISYELVKARNVSGDVEIEIDGLDNDLKEFVAFVCYGHRLKREEYKTLDDDTVLGNKRIRKQLLSRLLRIGDSLDVTSERVRMGKMAFGYIQKQSRVHWYKHHYTTGRDIDRHGVHLSFNLPCTEKEARDDQCKKSYRLIPEIVILELKREQYIHQNYFRSKDYDVFIYVDEQPTITYKEGRMSGLHDVGLFVTVPQPPLETMDSDLLELVSEEYRKLKEEMETLTPFVHV